MKTVTRCVRLLAYYLMAVSVIGVISESVVIIQSSTTTKDRSNKSDTAIGTTFSFNESNWNLLLEYSASLYENTFPVISPMIVKDQDSSRSYFPTNFSASSIVITILPTLFLACGVHYARYSYCQFWYWTQVASLLTCGVKIAVITAVGFWDAATNTAVIGTLLGLAQLWLVQTYMENLWRQRKLSTQRKYLFQNLTMDDGRKLLHDCKMVEMVCVAHNNNSNNNNRNNNLHLNLISNQA